MKEARFKALTSRFEISLRITGAALQKIRVLPGLVLHAEAYQPVYAGQAGRTLNGEYGGGRRGGASNAAGVPPH